MKRRHPALDYKGMCPFEGARHCEMRSGCATFAAGAGAGAETGAGAAAGSRGHAQAASAPVSTASSKSSAKVKSIVLTICYQKEERLGWEGLSNAVRKVPAAATPAKDRVHQAAPVHLVVSSGHHHPLTESLHAALKRQWGGTNEAAALAARASFLRALAARGPAKQPPLRVLFQQAEPQHFPTADGGFDAKVIGSASRSGPRQCRPLSEMALRVADLERELVAPHLTAAGGAILETNVVSSSAWWAHTYAAPTPSGNSDCTHYCMPGVPDLWASRLLRQLGTWNALPLK